MALPCDQRLQLIESLNLRMPPDLERLWSEEAERRVKEVADGTVTPIPGDQVLREIDLRLG
jgi:putative addiction module component (TIGR02574 family)